MAEVRVSKPTILFLFFLLLVHICSTTVIREKNGNKERYIVAFEADSQLTIAHVFRFDQNSNLAKIEGKLATQFGGKSFESQEVASVLAPLLQKAVNVIPVNLRLETPLILGVTDELLLLGEEKLNKILQEVHDVFSKTPLLYNSQSIKIIPGAKLGVYLWAAVNYLLGNLRGDNSDTVSVLDQDRATVDTTYAISNEVANEAKANVAEKNYITNYYFNGTEYYLYSHSYMGYGAYAARGEILKYTNDSYTYCVVNDHNVQYDYYGTVYNVRAAPSGSNYEKCKANVLKALKLNATCDLKNCTFNGVWNGGGGAGVRNLYLSNGFHNTGADLGIVNGTSTVMRLTEYGKLAKEVCELKSMEEALKRYPNIFDKGDVPYLCMDLVYLYYLLVDGFAIDPTKVVTAVSEVKYGESYLEASWSLGAALEIISSDHTRKPYTMNNPYVKTVEILVRLVQEGV